MTRIPHAELAPTTLRAIVLEFVTRDGTDHSPIDRRVETVLHQLDVGRVFLSYDEGTQTCNILRSDA